MTNARLRVSPHASSFCFVREPAIEIASSSVSKGTSFEAAKLLQPMADEWPCFECFRNLQRKRSGASCRTIGICPCTYAALAEGAAPIFAAKKKDGSAPQERCRTFIRQPIVNLLGSNRGLLANLGGQKASLILWWRFAAALAALSALMRSARVDA